MNLNEVNKLIEQVTELIKEKARYISQEEDEYKYILLNAELQHLKDYLQLLKSLQKKFSQMSRITDAEKAKVKEIKKYLKEGKDN